MLNMSLPIPSNVATDSRNAVKTRFVGNHHRIFWFPVTQLARQVLPLEAFPKRNFTLERAQTIYQLRIKPLSRTLLSHLESGLPPISGEENLNGLR